MTTDRREFLAAAGAGLGLGAIGAGVARGSTATGGKSSARGEKFSMHFAPHLGMFRHHAGDDPIAQLEFMADAGFTAFEDNGMGGRDHDLQRRMAQTMERVGLTMGVFVASAHWGEHTFVKPWREVGDRLAGNMRNAVEIAKRVNAKWCTVLLDAINHRVDMAYQTANAIECLKRCAEICEPAGLVMVLEPLNPRDHPELFLSGIPQAYQICRAVGSPSCKILDDLYHQQITEGNLIPNIDAAWDEIAYIQVGDNPGRREPTTGEINYANVFAHLKRKGFTGVVGMEHGNSKPGKEGELAVIEAYRAVDPA